MKNLVFVAVLLLIGVLGLGFYQGWFHFSTNSAEEGPSATILMDQNKMRADEAKVKEKLQDLGQETRSKAAAPGRTDKVHNTSPKRGAD